VGVSDYAAFLDSKTHANTRAGFTPRWVPDWLFDYQSGLVTWAIEQGRSAMFADCGLGKTPMALVWAENVVRETGGNVLILTPLAVGAQFVAEAEKFGVKVRRSADGTSHPGITITNYERLHLFNPRDFAGCVCDESSILKNFDGTRRGEITAFMRKMTYRLLATATAAPNDFTELGTSSEALGYLGHMDMLNKFFRNDLNNSATGRIGGRAIQWRFKGHAERAFWRWVCSWARAMRQPSDIGFENGRNVLPELIERQHIVETSTLAEGLLFALPAVGLAEQRDERKRTIPERCEYAAGLVNAHNEPATVWCHLNEESALLARLIPDAVEVSGNDSDDDKERKLLAFQSGDVRVLVTKPKIGAWGLNFQHCAHMVTFPSHSFEQYYQSVRRQWRFGQTRPVTVDVVAGEGEREVLKNLQRKQAKANEMFANLVTEMTAAMALTRPVRPTVSLEVPAWLSQAA
jgi:hypothetical protein